jgi:NDP-sugar pyrophosphorylase family protein
MGRPIITQAVISAGGLGTRLRPFTDTMPKPMIPLLGKPLLEHHVEQFKKFGVKEFFFTLHYLPEVIMNYFGDGSKWGVQMHYFTETTPLGTAGGIKQFELQLNDLFYFIYGDTVSVVDYGKMADVYGVKRDPIGMQRMKRTDDYADADVAEIDSEGRFVAIHGKPHTEHYQNAYRMRGVFILDKRTLRYIPAGKPFDLGKNLLPEVVNAGENFYAYECDDYSKGIDTLEKWKEVEEYLQTHQE